MLEWLFGSKIQEKSKKSDELGQDEKWVYDYCRQYLTSPIWRNPLLDFIEENCIVFDDAEENKFQYTKIFQEFTGLAALLLETMIEEVGIPEKTLQKCIIKGMKGEKDAKIFQQILLCDNFLSFKKIMVSKNKELEGEALKKIHHQNKEESKQDEKQIQINDKELEMLEIQKAIAMSLAVEEKAKSEEEKELEEAIKLSQLQYQKEEEKKFEEIKKEQPKAESKKSLLGDLPPLVIGTSKANRPVQEFKEEEVRLRNEIEDLKKEQEIRRAKEKEDVQNSEERKKRLLEQRELIRKKKQQQRKEELTSFVTNKAGPTSDNKASEEEIERRRNLMKKLKEQLKD